MKRSVSALLVLCVLGVAGLWGFRNGACADPAKVPEGWSVYRDPGGVFTIAYPPGWRVDAHYQYTGFGPDHPIAGVAFDIPESMANGTDLSAQQTSVSVETLPPKGACDIHRFVPDPENVRTLVENGRIWSVGETEDAGAGNRYAVTAFVLSGSSPCLAVRYVIHSTAIGNYPAGTIKAFDRHALLAQFDAIRQTLTPAH